MDTTSLVCPVCTLYLRAGINLEDHLQTHPKDKVIEALVAVASNLNKNVNTQLAPVQSMQPRLGPSYNVYPPQINNLYAQAPWHQNRDNMQSTSVIIPVQQPPFASMTNNQSIFYQQYTSNPNTGQGFSVPPSMVPQYFTVTPELNQQNMLANPYMYQQQQFQIIPNPVIPPIVSRTVEITPLPRYVPNPTPVRITEIATSTRLLSTSVKTSNSENKSAENSEPSITTSIMSTTIVPVTTQSPDIVAVEQQSISVTSDSFSKNDLCTTLSSDTAVVDKLLQSNTTESGEQSDIAKDDWIEIPDEDCNEDTEALQTNDQIDNELQNVENEPDSDKYSEHLEETHEEEKEVVVEEPIEDKIEDLTIVDDDNENEKSEELLEDDQKADEIIESKSVEPEGCEFDLSDDSYDEDEFSKDSIDIVDEFDKHIDEMERIKNEKNDELFDVQAGSSGITILQNDIINLPMYSKNLTEKEEDLKILESGLSDEFKKQEDEEMVHLEQTEQYNSWIDDKVNETVHNSGNSMDVHDVESMNILEFDGMQLILPGNLINTNSVATERNFQCVQQHLREDSPVLLNIGDIDNNDSKSKLEPVEESTSHDSLNIRADERMPPHGELSEQESNGANDVTWGKIFQEGSSGVSTSYDLLARESWEASDCSDTEVPPLQSRVPPKEQYSSEPETDLPSISITPPRHYKCTLCGEGFPCPKERRVHQTKEHSVEDSIKTAKKNSQVIEIKSQKTEIKTDDPFSESVEDNLEQDDVKVKLENVRIKIETFNCQICTSNFKSMKLLLRHHKSSHNGEPTPKYKCETCNDQFSLDSEYSLHLKTHPLECNMCGKMFNRRQSIKLHIRRHLGIKPFKCTVCSKAFITKQKLSEHINCHTGNSPLKCNMCEETFKRHSNLIQHRNFRHLHMKKKVKDYICECGEICHSVKKFLWHKETHDTKPKSCMKCNQKFIHAASLTRHIRRSHNRSYVPDLSRTNENVNCPVCNDIFLKASLEAHLRTHDGLRPYQCGICNKEFTTKWNLKVHKWTHAARSSKPFKCKLCNGAFIRQTDFIAHMNSHRKVRPYTCNYCGCQFIRKYNCQRHVKEHEQNKQHECTICKKFFHRSYYLKEHLRVHSGMRPHSCHICGKTSATKSNHNKHVRIHHAREPMVAEG